MSPATKPERKDLGCRPVQVRLKDYHEVEQNNSPETVIAQATRCLDCGTPFCHGYACPLANIIPEINAFISAGHWQEALELLLSTHPFPEFTARVCPALCEGSCVLGINEKAVSIRQIEKAIIEMGFSNGWVLPHLPENRRQEKIAVIGSGPAGLAVADRLNRKGYRVRVYEKDLHPGGLLTYGIPNFKLEKSIVMRRLNMMKEEGIYFETAVNVGTDISYNYLKRRYDAIVLAGGSEQPRDLDVEGRQLNGIYFAMDLLKTQNRSILKEADDGGTRINARNKKTVIIGGGDTGSDCVGTLLRQGAASVTQIEIMPRPPAERSSDNPWPLWPRIERASSSRLEAEHLGAELLWSVKTNSFSSDSHGNVSKVHCSRVEWMPGCDGPATRCIEESSFTLEADLVFLALGFSGPGPDPVANTISLERDSKGAILVDSNHMTSVPGLFSAGDIARGQSLVVHAISDGIAAAEGVADYLQSASRQ